MQFYGVGTRFGGTDCFLDDCCKYNFWCMGNPNEKQMKLYEGINVGNILIAKKYRMKDGAAFVDVEAIGMVTDREFKHKSVPAKFTSDDIYGVSVVWIKRFSDPISFSSKLSGLDFGGGKTCSIYSETSEKWIAMIEKMMKYDYPLAYDSDEDSDELVDQISSLDY